MEEGNTLHNRRYTKRETMQSKHPDDKNTVQMKQKYTTENFSVNKSTAKGK